MYLHINSPTQEHFIIQRTMITSGTNKTTKFVELQTCENSRELFFEVKESFRSWIFFCCINFFNKKLKYFNKFVDFKFFAINEINFFLNFPLNCE